MYAEAYVTVHQYDIVLDVTVINRTGDTLQNLCLELATMGDLKLVERPQNYTLGPGATRTVRCAAPPAGPVPAEASAGQQAAAPGRKPWAPPAARAAPGREHKVIVT